jgi:hypothetical protein
VFKTKDPKLTLAKWLPPIFSFPWFEIVDQSWKISRQIMQRVVNQGMYEVLEYESTLELKDSKGKQASFQNRM